MSKENVILIDYDAPNDWEFHKAIEKATGNKWRVYKAVSNENHGGVLQKFIRYELKICRDYRDGKVTKEDLDKCSTCDMNCVINNGLSEASKEQLKHKTGEEIVDADIAQQMETK